MTFPQQVHRQRRETAANFDPSSIKPLDLVFVIDGNHPCVPLPDHRHDELALDGPESPLSSRSSLFHPFFSSQSPTTTGSGSIGQENYEREWEMAASIAETLAISDDPAQGVR